MRRLQPVSLSSNVLDALAAYIEEMQLKPGDRLPAERVVAEGLGVSRPMLREALGRWAALGLIETRNGSGTFLRKPVAANHQHLIVTLSSERQSLLQTLELRRALETEVVALAAKRASPEQVEQLWTLLRGVEEAYARSGDAPDEDWAFHRAIYEAAGNPLFVQLIQGTIELFHRFWENPLNRPNFARRGLPYHRELVERIAARDPVGASAAVQNILRVLEEDLN